MNRLKILGISIGVLAAAGFVSVGIRGACADDGDGDTNDASNPALVEVQPPQWLDHDNSAIVQPAQWSRPMDDQEQEVCARKILGYVNAEFHTSFTDENIAPVQLPDWKVATRGFVRGGGYNIRIRGYQTLYRDPETGFKQRKLGAGRYMPWSGYFELGVHPTLHLPGSINGYQTFTRKEVGDKQFLVDFVAHIDSADPFEPPVGSLVHLFRDVVGSRGRNPCPGKE